MEYLVINQDDVGMMNPVKCGDIPAVERAILEKLTEGRQSVVLVQIPFSVSVKVREGAAVEASKSKTKSDKVAKDPGDGEVRPGDEGSTS